LFLTLPEITRGPIQLPQAIENRSSNPVFGVGREGDFSVALIFRRCINKTHDACVHKVIQFDVNWKRSLNVSCNRGNKRQVFQDQLVPAGGVLLYLVLA
jgi:hypothetical protein